MSINQDILDYYADRLRVLGKVSIKRMFGGAGFYLNGRMFALTDGIFWIGMLLALAAGFIAALPINYIFAKRGVRHAH